MKTLCYNFMKINFRKPFVWVVMGMVILSSIVWTYVKLDEQKSRPFIGHDVYRVGGMWYVDYLDTLMRLETNDSADNENFIKSAQHTNDIQRQLAVANQSDDIHMILELTNAFLLHDLRRKSTTLTTIEKIQLKNAIMPYWTEIFPSLPYDDFSLPPMANRDYELVNAMKLNLDYYYLLYENGTTPIYPDSVETVSYWYHYSLRVLPYITIAATILLGASAINSENSTGSIKLLCTNGIKRKAYYLSKWLSGSCLLFIITIGPMLVYGLGIGAFQGRLELAYPVTSPGNQLSSIKSSPSYYDQLSSQKEIDFLPHNLSLFVPNSPYMGAIPVGGTHWIPFYQHFLSVLILHLLFIAFLYAYILILSTVIEQSALALVLALLTTIGFTGAAISLTSGDHINWVPYTMYNASRTTIGLNNTTILASTLILTFSTLICLTVGQHLFNRKSL